MFIAGLREWRRAFDGGAPRESQIAGVKDRIEKAMSVTILRETDGIEKNLGLLATIGSGTIGRADGDYATAQFNTPQGMALDRQTLYVADTENHLIRKVDLAGKKVTTVAGTGSQNRGTPPMSAWPSCWRFCP